MARKAQISIQDQLESNEDFEEYIRANYNMLICLEVYSEFCGPCLATQNAIRKGKLEIGPDKVAMAKAPADNIDALERFRDKSEPVFLFIMKGKLLRAVFGANGIELCTVLEEELETIKREEETGVARETVYEITDLLPEEAEKREEVKRLEEEHFEAMQRLKELVLSARKKRVNERLITPLHNYNFILFFPHCHQAHYDLYELIDSAMISVAAKETIQINPDDVKEILYMSDVDANEACVYFLCNGPALVVLFKITDDDDRDFVKLMRYLLYEVIPKPKEDTPPEKQLPPIPAYERYASISKTAREVRRERYNERMEKKRKEKEEQERLAREQARLEREAEEERQRELKEKAEKERMARLAAGLPADPEPEEVAAEGEGEGGVGEGGEGEELKGEGEGEHASEPAPEGEVKEEEEPTVHEEQEPEFHSDVEVEGEDYIPPAGMFVPGLYAPPNELAKNNGIVFFFPRVVEKITKIESEHLPPHILVMFNVDKRKEILDMVKELGPTEILAKGFFVGDDPMSAEHLAYSLKQYDEMARPRKHLDRLALMVSRKRSLPLLQLTGFNPVYISSDLNSGERDCLQMFPVGYGDEYVEVESVEEEEIVEAPPPPEPEPEEAPQETEPGAVAEEQEEEDG